MNITIKFLFNSQLLPVSLTSVSSTTIGSPGKLSLSEHTFHKVWHISDDKVQLRLPDDLRIFTIFETPL